MSVSDAFALAVRAPVRFTAYDGSSAGPTNAAVELRVRSPKALAYLLSAPGELGLARAYISDVVDLVADDHYTALRTLAAGQLGSPSWRQALAVLASLPPRALIPVAPPPQEVGTRRILSGLRHSRSRDARAIRHHYDVSNRFYSWVLGPSMAYTCAVFPGEGATLEEAQAEKFDLVCRKLALKPGMRLLDVGCGWGGMVLHAVRHYGVTALGVTLSQQQAEWGQKVIVEQGLADRADIRHQDYREVAESGFDAIASIGLTEHIGVGNLDAYAATLAAKLRPGARLLNHCITRPDEDSPALRRRGFIDRYVFPDGELVGPGRVIAALERAGLEMRHEENLREHYARTLAAWCANLDTHWSDALLEVGSGTAKVWALYMAGSRLAFERNQIQLHQVLAVKPAADGSTDMPLRLDFASGTRDFVPRDHFTPC